MKIALCFVGQPRSAVKGYEYYAKNLLEHRDVDVFFHTWECKEAFVAHGLYNPKRYRIEANFKDTVKDCIDIKYTNTPDASKWPPHYTVCAYYSALHSCLLKTDSEMFDSGKVYDWVIKTRFDFALPARIPFEKLDPGTLYMPNCRTMAFGDWLGNDQFAIADSHTMNKYMSTFNLMNMFYDQGTPMIGEEMLRANIVYHNLREKIKYLQMERPFPPGPKNGTPHFLIRDDIDKWTE
jgi:hypothetical protein